MTIKAHIGVLHLSKLPLKTINKKEHLKNNLLQFEKLSKFDVLHRRTHLLISCHYYHLHMNENVQFFGNFFMTLFHYALIACIIANIKNTVILMILNSCLFQTKI